MLLHPAQTQLLQNSWKVTRRLTEHLVVTLLIIHANMKDAWKYVRSDGYIIKMDQTIFVRRGRINEPNSSSTVELGGMLRSLLATLVV